MRCRILSKLCSSYRLSCGNEAGAGTRVGYEDAREGEAGGSCGNEAGAGTRVGTGLACHLSEA